MWKNNRSSGISVMTAAFISALLLSLLCGLFYNAWKYEVERIQLEAERHAEEEAEEYHYELQAMYLQRDPQDTAPRMLFSMFLLIVALASLSLIAVIRNSFAVSMNGKLRQLGIFSSVGATPRQIRTALLQEAAFLCALPVLAGDLLGIIISMGLVRMTNILLGSGVSNRHEAVFGYHPLVFAITLLATVITVWISAWMPAGRLSRLTPLEAIKNTGELQLGRRKNSPLLTWIFGAEGELAGNALKAQRKALRTSSVSFLFAFLAFTIMQCFFSMTTISTRETYFERYQDQWDLMVTVEGAEVDSFEETGEIQGLPGVKSAVVYQKAAAKRMITEEEMSGSMKAFGGFSHASNSYVTETDGGWLVNAPVVILDDDSFLTYCEQIGILPRLDGAIVRNQIRDVTNPDFRHPEYMPYIKTENPTSTLRQSGGEETAVELSVLCYTEEVPILREEYATLDYYELVHFIPASLWKEIKGQLGGAEDAVCIRILGGENVTLNQLNALQDEVERLVSPKYRTKSENRIQEYETNDKQIQGLQTIFGSFCLLLAIIGIGNVFSNTSGFVRQRKREFARYMSVGMTPEEIRKLFCIEALVVWGRPILLALLPAAAAVWWMLRASYLELETFLAEAPFGPIALFMLAVLGSVALAYYLGWRNIRRINLAEALRDDTMM